MGIYGIFDCWILDFRIWGFWISGCWIVGCVCFVFVQFGFVYMFWLSLDVTIFRLSDVVFLDF